jgi:RNA polymerase sigma factor (sigma-70 family)
VTRRAIVEHLLREWAPQVLTVLVKRYGQFDGCEDATQEALISAAEQWHETGLPDNPRAWLITVASRRFVDRVRSERSRRQREEVVATRDAVTSHDECHRAGDDTLTLLFLCCHPALSPASQIALTLRAVGGLTTAEIASALLVSEATMTKRITRAKQTIESAGATFEAPTAEEWPARLNVVLHVLYLIFNEGYTASSGRDLQRPELATEAIRLTRTLRQLLPDHSETAGLLALMLLTDARRPARADTAGELIPLAEQDRSLWNAAYIAEGVSIISDTLQLGRLGPYQLQAAIAAVHDEAESTETTDWTQVVGLYRLLGRIAPNPMTTLSHAVAVAEAESPKAALELLDTIEHDERVADHFRLDAVRGYINERAGNLVAARTHYLRAAANTASLPEQRYLTRKAAQLGDLGA